MLANTGVTDGATGEPPLPFCLSRVPVKRLFLPAGLAPSLKLGPDFSHLRLSPLLVFSLVQLLISFMSVETLSAFLADRPRISA